MMQPAHWQKVKEVFYSALSLPPQDRASFLDEACSGDVSFRSDVESLLNAYKSDFLEDNVWPDTIGDAEAAPLYSEGEAVGHYKIVKLIGRGGMGDVYEAIDTTLDRRVALKFLSEKLRNDARARERLRKEARAVAKLQHPGICQIYGLDSSGDDLFLAMPYVRGAPLDKTLGETTIDDQTFLDLAKQIADAVAYAHSEGIIHRDLKPGNIMVTPEGAIKILDFGLAKLVDKSCDRDFRVDEPPLMSIDGLIVGTLAYMSPEQLRGEPLDPRTDIFSLGVIFFEMLTGRHPFAGASKAEVISAILTRNPLSERICSRPTAFSELIRHCIATDREQRFKSAYEITESLDTLKANRTLPAKLPRRHAVLAAALLAIVVGTTYSFFSSVSETSTLTSSKKAALLIIPIVVDEAIKDKNYLAAEIDRSLRRKLSKLESLTIRDASSLASVTDDRVGLLEVGKRSKSEVIFVGRLVREGNFDLLKTKLIDVDDGKETELGETRVDGSSLRTLGETLSLNLASHLNIKLSESELLALAKRDTFSDDARSYYLTGLYYSRQSKDGNQAHKAIEAFNAAKDIDQNYAAAWAGLAVAYLFLSSPGAKDAIEPAECFSRARLAAEKAIELDPDLPETYHALGKIESMYDWDWTAAESYFRKAIDLDPDFLPARFNLVNTLRTQCRYDEAFAELQKIREIDPLTDAVDQQLVMLYYDEGDYDRADAILRAAISRSPDSIRLKYMDGYVSLTRNRPADAERALVPIHDSDDEPRRVMSAAPLAVAYARLGKNEKVRAILDDLKRINEHSYVPPQEVAIVYTAMNKVDEAFASLELACSQRSNGLPGVILTPILANLRTDPRFAKIRACARV